MKRDTRNLLKEIKSLDADLTKRLIELDNAIAAAYRSGCLTQHTHFDASLIRSHIRKLLLITPKVVDALQDVKPV